MLKVYSNNDCCCTGGDGPIIASVYGDGDGPVTASGASVDELLEDSDAEIPKTQAKKISLPKVIQVVVNKKKFRKFDFLVAKLLYNSLCLSVRQSVFP